MSTAISEPDVDADALVSSMARAVALANRRIQERGIDLRGRLVSAAQRPTDSGVIWLINYMPNTKECMRGGDDYVEVDASGTRILREMKGQ